MPRCLRMMRGDRLRQLTHDHRLADIAARIGVNDLASSPGAADTTTIADTHASGYAGSTSVIVNERSRAATSSNVITRAVGATAVLTSDEARLSVADGDIYL